MIIGKKISSRMKLILLLIIPSTLLVAVVIYVAQHQTVRYLRQTQVEALSGMSRQVAYLIEKQMDDVVLNMLEIEQTASKDKAPDKLLESMNTLIRIRSDLIRGIVYIDQRGSITGYPEYFWGHFSEQEQKLIQEQSKEGSPTIAWSDPFRSGIGRLNVFSPVSIISKNVYDENGVSIGKLAFVVDLTYFLQGSAAFTGNYDTQTLLFDRNNQLIDTLTISIDNPNQQTSYKDEHIQTLPEALKYFSGNNKYYATTKLSDHPNWKIVIVGDVQKLEQQFDPVIHLAILVCTIGIAGLALIYIIVSWWFTRPILVISRGIRTVAKGDLDYTFPIIRMDEFGELALEINRMMRTIKQLIVDLTATEEKKRQADFQVLLSQINPHFLYNTLNTIDILIDFGEKRELHQVMSALTRLLKYGLDRSTDLRPLHDELHNIKDYLYILSIRYGNRFTFNVVDPGELTNSMVLKLILQPIVENAVFHGLHPLTDRAGRLVVTAVAEGNDIRIVVEDNGVGMAKNKVLGLQSSFRLEGMPQENNIGLQNVNRRIQLYYGLNYGLQIDSEEGVGTTITVRLKIQKEKEEEQHA